MKIIIIFLMITFPIAGLCSEKGLIKGIEARRFQLIVDADTIDFITINGAIDVKKPVLIFCQGSNPIPLIVIDNTGNKFIPALSNFNYSTLAQKYHIVVISMPHTPIEVPEKYLNSQYSFITDTTDTRSYSKEYLEDNYLDNYVKRAKEVITYLYEQDWIVKDKIYLLGHSQGSKVAIGAGLNNSKIAKIGFLSGNPIGRIDQLIREQRKLANTGKISKEESQANINNIYNMWSEINESPLAISTEFGDPNKTWTSFSKPLLCDILKINQPLYVAYGTEDMVAAFCDLLPIYFVSAGKNNLTLKPYIGLEHNFFEVDNNNRINFEKCYWQKVIEDFTLWIEE